MKLFKKYRLSKNVFANISQAIASTILMLIMYRYISDVLDVAMLGIWSVVIATISASRLIDIGFSSAVTYFIAKFNAQKNFKAISETIDTLVLVIMILLSVLMPFLYLLLKFILGYIFDSEDLEIALKILPFSLVSFWFIIIASLFQGALDGLQRMPLRAVLNVTSQLLLLIFIFINVPEYGIVGLAIAQIYQGIYLFIFGRLMIMRFVKNLKLLPVYIKFNIIKQMYSYGGNVQLSSLLQLIQEPLTKGLVASFGGALIAGYYEMAYQIVTRIRSFLIIANNAVVPHVSSLKETTPNQVKHLFVQNFKLMLIFSIAIYCMLNLWAGGIVSFFLKGNQPYEFIFIFNILIITWGINTISAPPYFFNMGDGRVWHNTKCQLLISFLNILLAIFFGYYFRWEGVILGSSLAVIIGSLYLIISYRIDNESILKMINLKLTMQSFFVTLIYTLFYIYGWFYTLNLYSDSFLYIALIIIVPISLLCFFIYYNPLIRKILRN